MGDSTAGPPGLRPPLVRGSTLTHLQAKGHPPGACLPLQVALYVLIAGDKIVGEHIPHSCTFHDPGPGLQACPVSPEPLLVSRRLR